MESIELLYNIAKVDAVELEMITKEEYDAIERKSPYLGAIDATLLREE